MDTEIGGLIYLIVMFSLFGGAVILWVKILTSNDSNFY